MTRRRWMRCGCGRVWWWADIRPTVSAWPPGSSRGEWVGLVVVLGVAGCGGADRGAPITSPVGMRALPASVARASVPWTGAPQAAERVVMLDAKRGVLVGSGVVQRTTDGGAQWTTTYAEPRVWPSWVGRDGDDVVAASRDRLLRSHDAGRTWRAVKPRFAGTSLADGSLADLLAFSGHGVGLSWPSASSKGYSDHRLLRTVDGGRHWRAVRLPGGGRPVGQASWAPGGRTVYVTGLSADRHCTPAVWRSDDAARRWRLLRGACGLGATGLWFTDAEHGVASGGFYSSALGRGESVVWSTDDGGKHWLRLWRRTSRDPHRPTAFALTELVFADRRNGWALSGGIKDSANTRYGGDALVTSDGGRHWRDSGQWATALSTAGPRRALAIEGESLGLVATAGAVARTRDGGRHWHTAVPADAEQTVNLLGDARGLAMDTDRGSFTYTAGTTTWRRARAPRMGTSMIAFRDRAAAWLVATAGGCRQLVVRGDGRPQRRREVPGCGPQYAPADHVAFAGRGRALAVADALLSGCLGTPEPMTAPLYVSADAGRTWRRRSTLPRALDGARALAADGNLAAALGCGAVAAISRDGGRSWKTASFARGLGCPALAVSGAEIWIGCDRLIYRSPDAGHSWQVHRLPAVDLRDGSIAPLTITALAVEGSGRAFASAGGSSLLQTRNGGAHWQQLWPSLPLDR